MDNAIELSFDSPAGVIDCRLEPERVDGKLHYSATILYPNIVNGFSRSEIYVHNLQFHPSIGAYCFDTDENDLHPRIRKLENKISDAIIKAG